MTLSDFRLIRLLPLASLVLTACVTTPPQGPGKSPDSPQWREHQQEIRKLNQYQTRGAFAYLSDEQKFMRASSGSRPVRIITDCC
jgi:Outer membrane lipoprotein involved in outer membrane biogenesis